MTCLDQLPSQSQQVPKNVTSRSWTSL